MPGDLEFVEYFLCRFNYYIIYCYNTFPWIIPIGCVQITRQKPMCWLFPSSPVCPCSNKCIEGQTTVRFHSWAIKDIEVISVRYDKETWHKWVTPFSYVRLVQSFFCIIRPRAFINLSSLFKLWMCSWTYSKCVAWQAVILWVICTNPC